jgi:hypothetical protein
MPPALLPAAGRPAITKLMLAPLAESLVKSSAPEAKGVILLGDAPLPQPEYGAWRLAGMERRKIAEKLYGMRNPAQQNRCSLHSCDSSTQLTVSIPELSGVVQFETVWYPPEVSGAGAYAFTLVTAGRDGAGKRVAAEEVKEYPPGTDTLIKFSPRISIAAFQSLCSVEIYVTPYSFPGIGGAGATARAAPV